MLVIWCQFILRIMRRFCNVLSRVVVWPGSVLITKSDKKMFGKQSELLHSVSHQPTEEDLVTNWSNLWNLWWSWCWETVTSIYYISQRFLMNLAEQTICPNMFWYFFVFHLKNKSSSWHFSWRPDKNSRVQLETDTSDRVVVGGVVYDHMVHVPSD